MIHRREERKERVELQEGERVVLQEGEGAVLQEDVWTPGLVIVGSTAESILKISPKGYKKIPVSEHHPSKEFHSSTFVKYWVGPY